MVNAITRIKNTYKGALLEMNKNYLILFLSIILSASLFYSLPHLNKINYSQVKTENTEYLEYHEKMTKQGGGLTQSEFEEMLKLEKEVSFDFELSKTAYSYEILYSSFILIVINILFYWLLSIRITGRQQVIFYIVNIYFCSIYIGTNVAIILAATMFISSKVIEKKKRQ